MRLPCALIRVQDAPCDPEHDEEPDLLGQTFDITTATANPNDPFGRAAIMGACRTPLASPGKGILEIEDKLFEAIKSLGASSGVRIMERGKSGAPAEKHSSEAYMAMRAYRFEALVTAFKSYDPVRKLVVSGGSGSAALTWRLPFARFDYFGLTLRYALGSTAPATPTSGSPVVLNSTDTSKSVLLAAGTYSFSLFAAYDEYATGAASQWSPAASKTNVVVT